MNKVLDEVEARTRHDLSFEQIEVNRSDMPWRIAVHRTNEAAEKKLQPPGDIIDVRRGYNGYAVFAQEPRNPAKEGKRIFEMFDHLDGSDYIESGCESSVEIGFVEIEEDEFGIGLEIVGTIDCGNPEPRSLQSLGERARTGAEIERAAPGREMTQSLGDHQFVRARYSEFNSRSAVAEALLHVVPEADFDEAPAQRFAIRRTIGARSGAVPGNSAPPRVCTV